MKRGLLAVLAAVAAEIALALLAAEFGSAVSSFFYFVPCIRPGEMRELIRS